MIASLTVPKVRLYVVSGKHTGESFRVRGPAFVIGRAPDCQLRPDSPEVSRRHAEIDFREDTVILRDLCSRNGTLLNGEPIYRPTRLADGDRIKIGSLLMIVTIWTPEGSFEADDSDDGREAEGIPPELSPEDEAAIEAMFQSMEITESMAPNQADSRPSPAP